MRFWPAALGSQLCAAAFEAPIYGGWALPELSQPGVQERL